MVDQRSATARDGRQLTYRVVGSGPFLLCHPGGPGFPGSYFEDLAGVAEFRTLVLVNPAGTDGSDPWTEKAYSLERRGDDLEDLRRALDVNRVDVLGHSAGGWEAVHFAATQPEHVDRLLLVGTLPRFSDELRAALARQARLHEHDARRQR